jgi:PRC-barrel domain
MPDDPICLAHLPAPRRRQASMIAPLGLALLALNLGLMAPLHAQTGVSPAPAANPVRVAELINLPIVDENKAVLGRVRAVVRTGDGKIQLLLPLGGLFGFGERLVPIPIESVAVSGPQVTVTDMPPHRFQKNATWYGSDSETLAATETISINRR